MLGMCGTGNNENPIFSFPTGSGPQYTGRGQSVRNDTQKMFISPEIFVGLELSIVPEVERVFVERIENGKTMRVMVMVRNRDSQVRRRVYAREQEIIDAHPQFDFDFYVHPLMGRNPAEVVDGMGKLAYSRVGA
jgi:hypothetical protein